MPRRRWSYLAGIVLPQLAAVAYARQAPPSREFSDLERVVADELKESITPGAAVAVVSGDSIVFTKGFGIANVETRARVTPDMLFRTGSIAKMLTATVLVSLSEEGKLSLDAPLGNAVKGLGPRLSRVTPHQLMTHSAGLVDDLQGNRDDDFFFTEPGRIFSYANPGS
jgi:CubicO group peptidase (beta-lactamase class C family)